jgi:hypothetical protein
MLDAPAADTDPVFQRALVLTAIACSALVAGSFALFARDQLAGASKHQQNEIIASVPTTPRTVPMSHQPAQPRRFIDGAANALISPFKSIVQSHSQWVLHGIPTIIALLVYGVGLGYLARYSRGLS